LHILPEELTSCFNRPDHEQRLTYDEFRLCINAKASGAVRVSVGPVSNFADIEKLLYFVRTFLKLRQGWKNFHEISIVSLEVG